MRVVFLTVVVVWSYAVAVEDASVLSRLRPLASLPFFEGARHAQMLAWSSRWREELFGRVRFAWSGTVTGPIKVFANAPPWMAPDYRVNSTCDVPCDYAESLETAHAALSNMRPVAPYGGRVVNALMSFEPCTSRVRWSSGSDPWIDRRLRTSRGAGTSSAWPGNASACPSRARRTRSTSSSRRLPSTGPRGRRRRARRRRARSCSCPTAATSGA